MTHYNYDYTTSAYLYGLGSLENTDYNRPNRHLGEEKQKPLPLQTLKWSVFIIASLTGIASIAVGISENEILSYTLAGSAFLLPTVWFVIHERRDRKNPVTAMDMHWAVIFLMCIVMFFAGIFLMPTS